MGVGIPTGPCLHLPGDGLLGLSRHARKGRKLGTAADEDTHKASQLFHVCTGVPNSRLPPGETNIGNVDFQEARA